MMIQQFSVKAAKDYGVNASILLTNIYQLIEHNQANDIDYHDGYYWISSSLKSFSQFFPFLTQRQIEVELKKLEKEGLIITGNYNETPFDRTKWYAISKKGLMAL